MQAQPGDDDLARGHLSAQQPRGGERNRRLLRRCHGLAVRPGQPRTGDGDVQGVLVAVQPIPGESHVLGGDLRRQPGRDALRQAGDIERAAGQAPGQPAEDDRGQDGQREHDPQQHARQPQRAPAADSQHGPHGLTRPPPAADAAA